jgi:hypothetical protein
MWGVFEQSLPFCERFVDQADFALLQVPQTAVDEL